MQKEVKQTQTTVKFRRKSWHLKLPKVFGSHTWKGALRKFQEPQSYVSTDVLFFIIFTFNVMTHLKKEKKRKKIN